MRTTVRLDEQLLQQAKLEAARTGETLTSLIERGLRLILTKRKESPQNKRIKLPTSKAGGGTQPGIDLNDSAELLDVMEGRK